MCDSVFFNGLSAKNTIPINPHNRQHTKCKKNKHKLNYVNNLICNDYFTNYIKYNSDFSDNEKKHFIEIMESHCNKTSTPKP